HPQWQRRIVPSLLQVMDILTGQHGSRVQLVAVTHYPLVLASVEPLFDAGKDAWFDLDLDRTNKPYSVKLMRRTYVRHGEVGNSSTRSGCDGGTSATIEQNRHRRNRGGGGRDPDCPGRRAAQLRGSGSQARQRRDHEALPRRKSHAKAQRRKEEG